MLMIVQSALTSRHRPHPRFAQNFRREDQLWFQGSSTKNLRIYRFSVKSVRNSGFGGFVSRGSLQRATFSFFAEFVIRFNRFSRNEREYDSSRQIVSPPESQKILRQ